MNTVWAVDWPLAAEKVPGNLTIRQSNSSNSVCVSEKLF